MANGDGSPMAQRNGGRVKKITLPWPHKALSSNARVCWAVGARHKATHREMARLACLEAPRIDTMPDATLFIEYYPPTRRGDVHNVPSSLKAYIDGIADAMGCDDKRFKVDYPTVWVGSGKPGKIVIRIVPPVFSAAGMEGKET